MSMTLDRAYKIIEEQKNTFLDKYIDFGGYAEAYDIALEAVKNLAPIKPKEKTIIIDDIGTNEYGYSVKDTYSVTNYYCGNCGEDIRKYNNYCHLCGRKIKWEN